MLRHPVTIGLLVLGLAGCGGGTSEEPAATAPPAPESTVGEPYPDEAREAFVDSCARGGPSVTQCQCILDSLEAQLPYTEFFKVSETADAARRKAGEECV